MYFFIFVLTFSNHMTQVLVQNAICLYDLKYALTNVLLDVLNLNFCNKWTVASFISIRARRIPMHVLGPPPKGR